MEWMPANKPIARQIRLAIKSFSDREQKFKLNLTRLSPLLEYA
jgi:hypothetical protein